MIEINSLNKQFGRNLLFKEVSVTLNSGQWIALTGESGTGKSTFLRILLGLVNPTKGSITWNGKPLFTDGEPHSQHIQQWRTKVTWTPQTIPFGNQTPRQVLQDLKRFHQNAEETDDINESDWINKLGLATAQLDQPFQQLSGGQYQRMLLGLSFELDRDWWLLDEPTSALDTQSRQRVADLLHKKKNCTMLISTHDDLLINECDRVLLLEDQKIRELT